MKLPVQSIAPKGKRKQSAKQLKAALAELGRGKNLGLGIWL